MARCIFVSDLHGSRSRYLTLIDLIAAERPQAVFLGGDLLPHPASVKHTIAPAVRDFHFDQLRASFANLRATLGQNYPDIFLILGNDDPRSIEPDFQAADRAGLWHYLHGRCREFSDITIYGYSCIPPSPFRLKDWECYDIIRSVDPGCIPPEAGFRTVPADTLTVSTTSIQQQLQQLWSANDLTDAVMLFHSPPHHTTLDRVAVVDQQNAPAPIPRHIGSLAIRRFIERQQPRITLHGHVHESARLTGRWSDRIGRTWLFSAAHDGEELAVVRFDTAAPERAARDLL